MTASGGTSAVTASGGTSAVTASGARVTLRGLTKTYGSDAEPTVDAIDLVVEPGTMTALLGPSGCGKTTTLKMLAGLLPPTGGQVLFDDRDVTRVPAEKRGVAMVFQKPLLFPHLTVGQNIAFGLRMRRVGKAETARRVAEMLELVSLPGYADRRAGELSGGQEQRVSLARALVTDPSVLLLDEPLSALDAALRVQMRALVREIQQRLGVTAVFVTHDQEEAVVLADRIALMLDGRVEQQGRPRDFYEKPATVRAAQFFGTENLLVGTVKAGWFTGPLGSVAADGVPEGPALLALRQEAVQVLTDGAPPVQGPPIPATAGVPAVVETLHYVGTALRLQARIGDAVVHAVTAPTVRLRPGDTVRLRVPAGHGHVLPT